MTDDGRLRFVPGVAIKATDKPPAPAGTPIVTDIVLDSEGCKLTNAGRIDNGCTDTVIPTVDVFDSPPLSVTVVITSYSIHYTKLYDLVAQEKLVLDGVAGLVDSLRRHAPGMDVPVFPP